MAVVFVAGVHGAGKTTLCRAVADLLSAEQVTAGALIRAAAAHSDVVSEGIGGKVVPDVEANQARLLRGLAVHLQQRLPHERAPLTLLDGHFTLMASDGAIARIPTSVFAHIAPVAVVLVEAPPETIVSRLALRDGAAPSMDTVLSLVSSEREHASTVCAELGLSLITASGDDAPLTAARALASALGHLDRVKPCVDDDG